MRSWIPQQAGLPGQPGRITRLGGASFLHVNAEGGVPRLTGVMFIRAFIFSLNIWKPHGKAGYLTYPGIPASMRTGPNWGDYKSTEIRTDQLRCCMVFEERGKPEYPWKNLSEQSREPTNLTHIWH